MLENKDFCDYDTCVALKELGYSESFPLSKDYEVLGKDYDILLYEAQKWLREEKGLFVEVVMSYGKYDFDICSTKLEQNMTHKILCEIWGFKTYEEALSEGIKGAVKILKEK